MEPSESGERRKERRRMPRLHFGHEQFRLAQTQKIYQVANLSQKGLGLRVIEREDLIYFAVGSELKGILSVHGEKIPCRVRVTQIRGSIVGAVFIEPSSELEIALNQATDLSALGEALRPMPLLIKNQIWFAGPSGLNLHVWFQDAEHTQVMRLFFSFFEDYIEWDEKLHTGSVMPTDEGMDSRGPIQVDSLWLIPDLKLNSSKIQVAKTLLLGSKIPEIVKVFCRTLESV